MSNLTERQQLKLDFVESLLWSYNYREAKTKEILWDLEYVRQELMSGGLRGVSLDPDKVPQKHKVSTGYGLDIISLISRRDQLEEKLKAQRKENQNIDRWLASIDRTTASMIVDRYIERVPVNQIAYKHGMIPMRARRWITSALLKYPEEEL